MPRKFRAIQQLRAAVTFKDERYSLAACFEGMLIPNPPSLAGWARSAHSRSFRGGLPVRAGSKWVHKLAETINKLRFTFKHILRDNSVTTTEMFRAKTELI